MGPYSSNPQTANQSAQPRYGRMDLGLDHVVGGIERAKD
jgi:squalene-hopene/tetraprenyl-beta-curcumene cyclase